LARTQLEQRISAGEPSQTIASRQRMKNYSRVWGIQPAVGMGPVPLTFAEDDSAWNMWNPSPVTEIPTDESSPSSLYQAYVAVAAPGTRVQFTSLNTAIVSVTIKALADNTGNVYVGGSGVTQANGYELSPGASISVRLDNLNKLYIDAPNAGDGIHYVAVR
jgi:hypothetical protein